MAKKLENETELGLKRRARKINRELAQAYPYAVPELDFENPFELLVATVLSAQTTDVRVNAITPALFARFPDALAMSQAERAELEQLIRPTGFFRAKADSLLGLSAALVERFDGDVPAKLDELVKLPGVGRKTANVVLGNAFGVPGITVDTHFGRLANRLGWTALLEAIMLSDGGPAHQKIVRLLIDAGADVNLPDRDGITPLQHAKQRGFGVIAQALRAAGAR